MKAIFDKFFILGVWAVCTFTLPAFAQTQQQQDRINQVAQYLVTAPLCAWVGMELDENLPKKAGAAFDAEMVSWGVSGEKANQLVNEALSRHNEILRTDLNATAGAAKSAAQLKNLSKILHGYALTCVAAAKDPIFNALIMLPEGYDLDAAVLAKADEMLEPGGLASWQTPRIRARGDLMMLAGACRSKIGAVRSDALVRQYGRSSETRERRYYLKAFDIGLSDPTIISTLQGCNRAIQATLAEAR